VTVCLQLDVGNSGAKWRLVDRGRVVERGRFLLAQPDTQSAVFACAPRVDAIWVASVADPAADEALSHLLEGHWGVRPWFARSAAAFGALRNSYARPERMGVDRWLAMIGARERAAGRLCVVDAGSALTIDLVAADGLHEGGYILPGPALMERALLLDTDRVRFDDPAGYALAPGHSTAEAVRHGIALAQAGAVGLALDCAGKDDPPSLLFCGGGGEALMHLLGRGGTWAPDLVFEGLEQAAGASGA
jgi:type III pantothenate kinase